MMHGTTNIQWVDFTRVCIYSFIRRPVWEKEDGEVWFGLTLKEGFCSVDAA